MRTGIMNYAGTVKKVRELSRHVEALGALGAAFAHLSGDVKANTVIESKLDAVRKALQLDDLDGISRDEMRLLHATVRASLCKALNLVEAQEAPVRWAFDDPDILQAQGKASRVITWLLSKFSERTESFSTRLNREARFLDVGSGVGWISISMAEKWPQLRVDGIDIHEPALTLAEENRASSVAAKRIAFSRRNVVELEEIENYACVFIPFIFMSEAIVPSALSVLYRAIEPRGWLFVAGYRLPDTALGRALTDLRTALSGGRVWDDEEIIGLLTEHGFEVIEDIGAGMPLTLFAARKA